MSRAALQLFVSSMNKSSCSPRVISLAEDLYLSKCLAANGGLMPNTRWEITESDASICRQLHKNSLHIKILSGCTS
jgi:hypothetical protein